MSELPPIPSSATEALGGESVDRLVRYGELLADQGVLRGLIGPREVPRLWERHLLNSAALVSLIPRDATVCDVGSGAGLPGLVVGLVRPDVQVTLLEPLLRRTTFLSEAVSELSASNVEVLRGRAEEVQGRTWDLVISRAVAPLDRLAAWCLPLARHEVLALKGENAQQELAEWRSGSSRPLPAEVVAVLPPGGGQQTYVVRILKERKGE